jgi:Nif-specific regulatory protein
MSTLTADGAGAGWERVALERDLYRGLLELGKQRDIQAFLSNALAIIVDLTGAERGYIELGCQDRYGEERTWSVAHGCDSAEIATIKGRVSRGIISEATGSGETVLTNSAVLDARFSARESIQQRAVGAVLCAPVGSDPPLGVIYLEGRRTEAGFDESDREYVELFGGHLAPLADRALMREFRLPDLRISAGVRELLQQERFVGRSRAFVDVLETAATVAPLGVHVLLTGDSGTGKTQLARIIHVGSPRSSEPFVEVNCAALPEDLVENELFGAAAGAHSTAVRSATGKIAAAGSGTLFLDEISELPMGAQAKLLQFLQSKQYFPLGSPLPCRSEARVIAATNTDLNTAVAEKRFRQDLMYRLEVLPIRMPSLAERDADIEDLMDHFCETIPARHGLPMLSLTPGARRAIRAAEWPGNVRQLEHALEAAVIRAAGARSPSIGAEHVFPGQEPAEEIVDETYQAATRRFQADFLRDKLEECDWNVAECARRLDLARAHVYNLIKAFGLTRDSS